MQVCLVSPLTVADFITPESSLRAALERTGPNLGILAIASALRQAYIETGAFHLDQHFVDFITPFADLEPGPSNGNPETVSQPYDPAAFFAHVRDRLIETDTLIYGFGSLSSSYPMTLRLAEAVKRAKPSSIIVFGGPQASVVDESTLEAFPFVDFIVRGEADVSFPDLARAIIEHGDAPFDGDLPGVTFRRGGKIIRNVSAPAIDDMDTLPLPAFDLDPFAENRGGLHLEAGRGCPYACTFCSTNDFFRRNFRLKSAQKLVDEMVELHERYGVTAFTLVHDMFTVNRAKVIAFCDELLRRSVDFTWSCSARTDRVDNELLTLMSKAGCRGIFFGIETGSKRLQTVVKKHLDLDQSWTGIASACGNKMETAVALITGFPDETKDDLRDTAHFFIDSLRLDNAEPQLSVLAPLAETPIATEHWDELYLDTNYSDMSHQGWRQDPEDLALIRRHKRVFVNFYAVPTENLDRDYFVDMRNFLMGLSLWFRWLPVAILEVTGDLVAVFDKWQAWPGKKDGEPGKAGVAPYYCRSTFQADFANFVRQELLPGNRVAAAVLRAIVDVEAPEAAPAKTPVTPAAGIRSNNQSSAAPVLTGQVNRLELEVDYHEILNRLRNRRSILDIPLADSSVLLVEHSAEEVEICNAQSLQGLVLDACRQGFDVDGIAHRLKESRQRVAGLTGRKLALGCLYILESRGLIGWADTDPGISADLDAVA